MSALLDVNVLVALAWPNHVHHGAAAEWFLAKHAAGWATCPLTESAFVRLSSNAAVTASPRRPTEAIELLRALRSEEGHTFWPDDVSLATADELDEQRLLGHRQVTDAHLLVLAARNGGRLVTFDGALTDLVPNAEVELLRL